MKPKQRAGRAAALCAAICAVLAVAAEPSLAKNAKAASAPRGSAPPLDTGPETIRLTPAEEAARLFQVPPGFHASLFAAEPMVRQPIGIATDSRGRLWVAENDTYSERSLNFDLSRHDWIVIMQDTDGDGRADRRTVFWDGAQQLTSVELGFGGVWALCP